jgi:RNA polymerase sigma-70 factor (ECF subfamily)
MHRHLVERAMAGDHDAFAELARARIGRLYAIAFLILRDPARAEDATQDALVAAWRDLSALRNPDAFDAWLRRLLVRACHREATRARNHPTIDVVIPAIEPAEADSSLSLAQRDEIERGFRRLDPDQRSVIVLHFYVGLPLPEVADALGIPLGTAKSRLHRAMRAMRSALEADARGPIQIEGWSA